MSEDALVAETTAFYVESERRLELCARCPDEGGACESEPSGFAPGERPEWSDEPRLVRVGCPKWREYEIRKRLGAAGVPPQAAGATFGSYPGAQQALDAVVRFFAAATSGNFAWLVLQGGHGSGKTHLSIACLRNAKIRYPRLRLRYLNVARLEPLMKAFYDNSRELPDPMEPFVRADIAVLDNFDPGRMVGWLQKRVVESLLVRWEEQRPTIVTSHESNFKTLMAALADLSGVQDAATRVKLTRTEG